MIINEVKKMFYQIHSMKLKYTMGQIEKIVMFYQGVKCSTSKLAYLAPYTSSPLRFDLTQITGHSAQTVVDVLQEMED